MCRALGLAVLAVACVCVPPCGAAEDFDIDKILAEMLSKGYRFKPESLRAAGVKGMSALLDRLFPQTAAGSAGDMSEEQAERLISDLGDTDFRIRRAATERLTAQGRAFRRLLAEAGRSEDPERATRAREIVAGWDRETKARLELKLDAYRDGLAVYLRGMKDPVCLKELAARTRIALEKGIRQNQGEVVRQCLVALAKSNDDTYCDELKPLLARRDAFCFFGGDSDKDR